MIIDLPLTSEELKSLPYNKNEDGEPMTEADFEQEILGHIRYRLRHYDGVAKRILVRNKTITELE
ncbi:hypothetical protein LCGC14_0376420 [marine sediment metagenome]|uniref:Uncharacterized protein n=1 Tax=marine sediment metagenome TaxID=412755 RepID=A0A0F9T9S8_9ZZZZ